MLSMSSYAYYLEKLKSPFHFDTDPKDGIRDVKLTLLQLKPYYSNCGVEFTVPFEHEKNIHEVIHDCFDKRAPFMGHDFYVEKAHLAIQFKTEETPRVVRLGKCFSTKGDVKSHAEREQQITNKCLKQWKLL